MSAVLADRVWELAGDVGRLQRRFASSDDELSAYLAARIAAHVSSIDLMLRPTAGELVAWNAPGDDEAVEEALRLVDEHWRQLQTRLGARP